MALEKFTIGRDPSADILIPEPSVSRIHAEMTLLSAHEVLFVDRRSSNGTYRLSSGAEQRIEEERLSSSDRIKLGNIEVPVSDLIAAARKQLQTRSASQASPAAAAERVSVRMVRCTCGAVREEHSACPYCAQG